MDAAESAKGTLVIGVVADETVEVEAPCIMGTFVRRVRRETERGGQGRRNVMIIMTKYDRGRGGERHGNSPATLPRWEFHSQT